MVIETHPLKPNMAETTRFINLDRRVIALEHSSDRAESDIRDVKHDVKILTRHVWTAAGFLTAIQVAIQFLRK